MKRRLAREIVVQSLYQLEMNEETTAEDAVTMITDEVKGENEIEANEADVSRIDEHVRELVQQISEKKAAIDNMLQDYLTGWQVDRLSRVDRQILRLACFELVYRDDVPQKLLLTKPLSWLSISVQMNQESL